MTTRSPRTRKSKKLTLNKQTLKDLSPMKGRGKNVRGGGAGALCTNVRTGCNAGGGGMGGDSGEC